MGQAKNHLNTMNSSVNQESLGKLLEKFSGKIIEHESLRDHSLLKVGGVADYFFIADTIKELMEIEIWAKAANLPTRIIGGASQCIFSDYGFPGLIIKNNAQKVVFLHDKNQAIVESGISGKVLAMAAASQDLGGVEFLSGMAGTLGGAVYNNYVASLPRSLAAGFSRSTTTNDYIKKITVLNNQAEIVTYKPNWLHSRPGQTRLRQMTVKPIILTLTLQLFRSRKDDIMRRLAIFQNNSVKDKSVTSEIFFNSANQTAEELIKRSNAWKLKVGQARVFKEMPNRIINLGGAKAQDIRALIDTIRQVVLEKTDVMLEVAIEYIGEW